MEAREGVVGDLILFETCGIKLGAEESCHLEAGLVVAWGELAFLDEGVEAGAGFDAEVVGGDVLRTELQDFVDAVFPGREGLGGEAVHQVEAEVGDAGVADEVDGLADVGGVVAPVEEAELAIDEGLDAEGEAGDGGRGGSHGWLRRGREGPGAVDEVFGVGFEGDFFAMGEVETGGEGAEEGGDVGGA